MFKKVIVLCCALGVAGCEMDGTNLVSDIQSLAGGGSASQSPAQKQLSAQQREYAKVRVTASAAGAVTGVAACKIAMGRDCGAMEMLIFAGVGAAAGYSGGSYLTRSNASFQASAETLQQDIDAARKENAQLAKNVSAAQGALKYQRSEIRRLNAAFKSGQVDANEYRASLRTMDRDVQTTDRMLEKARKDTASLQSNIANYRSSGLNTSALQSSLRSQRAKTAQLGRIKDAMLGVIGSAPASVRAQS